MDGVFLTNEFTCADFPSLPSGGEGRVRGLPTKPPARKRLPFIDSRSPLPEK
jgi:hypothetical protein